MNVKVKFLIVIAYLATGNLFSKCMSQTYFVAVFIIKQLTITCSHKKKDLLGYYHAFSHVRHKKIFNKSFVQIC